MIRVAYLGPAGTYSEDAVRSATAGAAIEARPEPTIHAAITAVDEGRAERALVPLENSFEGSVRTTLDALAFDAPSVSIVGEHDLRISTSLIAGGALELGAIEVLISHPQPLAQCATFIRSELGGVQIRAAASTAEAVREVATGERPWAALGGSTAARIYGGVILREGVEDDPSNVTRFVWLAPKGTSLTGAGRWKTTLTFSELGADQPGALVAALTEFSSRGVNLTRIESRPLRRGLGRYMFFIDLEGGKSEAPVAAAIEALRTKAENVRVIGSYPLDAGGVPGA